MKRLIILSLLILCALIVLPVRPSLAQEEQPQQGEGQQEEVSAAAEGKPAASPRGEPSLVTLDFEDADLRDVIRVIAMASGLNVVIGQDVEAKVTISLKQMHWEQALDLILRTYNFTYKREENLIRIMTFEKVKQEERDIPLVTKIIYLNFADVAVLQPTVSKMLSERGSIETDKRTNSMLITDIPAKVDEAELIAKKLDTRTPQVLIEAMLVNVSLTKDDELGINWSILNVNAPDNQGVDISDPDSSGNYFEIPSGTMALSGSKAINMGFLKRFGDYGVDGLVSAWISEAKANILASPKIVTLDNETAKIEITSQVAYTQATQNDAGGTTSSTQFKDVTTGLEVTPHITKEGYVSMYVKPQQEFVDGTVGDEPKIASRTAETNVLVKDGETLVIGGLRQVDDSVTIVKVPFLGDIPFIGKLFQKKDIQKINTELLMFVTPHIIDKPVLTDEEIDRYKMLDRAREEYVEGIEKERIKRMKNKRKHVLLIGPGVSEEMGLDDESIVDTEEYIAPAPAIKEKKIEENAGYIYSW